MKLLLGTPGWGWKMFGLIGGKPGRLWFIGFSRNVEDSDHGRR